LIADFQLFHSLFPLGKIIRLNISELGLHVSLKLNFIPIPCRQMSVLEQPAGGLYLQKNG
jgi:hypothetical protein